MRRGSRRALFASAHDLADIPVKAVWKGAVLSCTIKGSSHVTVKAGTTVTWSNHDDIPHTVVSIQKFRSKALDTEDSFSFTFTTPGEYNYFCSLHPHMTATIVVEAATGSSASQ